MTINKGGIIACRIFLIYSVPLQLLAFGPSEPNAKGLYFFGALAMFPANLIIDGSGLSMWLIDIHVPPMAMLELYFFSNLFLFYLLGWGCSALNHSVTAADAAPLSPTSREAKKEAPHS